MGHKFVLYIFFSSSDTLACVVAVRIKGKREGDWRGGGLSLLFPVRFSPPPPPPASFLLLPCKLKSFVREVLLTLLLFP